MSEDEDRFNEWLLRADDADVKRELEALKGDPVARRNAFYRDLGFGTAGLRGEMGAGTNCLNVYTIRRTTQGIADCMRVKGMTGAAISYDSRRMSERFAFVAAEVFAANGIRAVVTRELMPTPFLSYLVRATGADVGVMITASHNPAKYNGYKVYGADGCQLTDEAAAEMTDYIERVDPFDVRPASFNRYLEQGMISYAPDEITERYLADVYALGKGDAAGVRVAYTPLNGAGYKLVPAVLTRAGAEVIPVPEQSKPDGDFPTCPYPNPEKKEALALGIAVAERERADLLIATDPDCDRVATVFRTDEGYVHLSGNELGVLLTDYLLAVGGKKRPVIVKTIVTTELIRKIAAPYGAEVRDVLTGFKYIGDVIAKLEAKGEQDRFLIGFEESCGYLTGTHVRDKDGVNASLIVAQMASYYKKQGKTPIDRLNEIYAEFGRYEHVQLSYAFPGAAGSENMKRLLASLREKAPVSIAGAKVVKAVDYLTQTEADLPKSDVMSYSMADGSQLIVRPSGTEPIVKVYFTACGDESSRAAKFASMRAVTDEWFKVR